VPYEEESGQDEQELWQPSELCGHGEKICACT
jgi:hypothetical protein